MGAVGRIRLRLMVTLDEIRREPWLLEEPAVRREVNALPLEEYEHCWRVAFQELFRKESIEQRNPRGHHVLHSHKKE